MKTLSLAALALIAASPALAQDALKPVSAERAIALFKSLCADSFPDPERFAADIAADTGFEKQPNPNGLPGDAWFSEDARLGYAASDALPRDLPSPQCNLTVSLDAAPDHPAMAAALAAALGLPPAKTSGKGPRWQSQWDLPGDGVDKRRIFLGTQAGLSTGPEARISLLNLRGKTR